MTPWMVALVLLVAMIVGVSTALIYRHTRGRKAVNHGDGHVPASGREADLIAAQRARAYLASRDSDSDSDRDRDPHSPA